METDKGTKALMRIAAVLSVSAATAFADVAKIEKDAAMLEQDGHDRRAIALYREAAKIREEVLEQLEKIEAKRKKGAAAGLDNDLDYGADKKDEIGDDLGVTDMLNERLALQAAAQISELQVIAGYDRLHAAETNAAERLFAKAEKTTCEALRLATAAKNDELVKAAKSRLLDLRVYRKGYEPPKDAPQDQAADVWLAEIDILRRRGDFKGAAKAGEKALAAGAGITAVKKMLDAADNLPGRDETFAWLRKMAEDGRFGKAEKAKIWDMIGEYAWRRFRPEIMKTATEELAKLGAKGGRWTPALAAYAEMGRFPLPDSELVFPKTLADFGVKREGETVRVETLLDIDDDGHDMTKVIQSVIDSPKVTTVILGKLDRPWRISQLKLRSNLRIVLEKGAVVLGEDLSRRVEGMDGDMFLVKKVSNVIIEGIGERPEDCFIGKYATHAERKKNGKRYYGGSGIGIDQSSNVLVRNLKVSYNTCDGCSISGLLAPSRNLWFDGVVFDGNYRQGMSIVNGDRIYCRKVVFSGTDGNEPMAGVDLEPVYHTANISNIYFLDCEFADNVGSGLLIAAASYWPVTISARRCLFRAQSRSGVRETARTTTYTSAERPAVGVIVFEDCTLCRWMGQGAIRFEGCPLFDMKFVNSVVKVTDDRPRGTVPDGSFVTTNTAWSPKWADWKKYPFSPKLDFSGLRTDN